MFISLKTFYKKSQVAKKTAAVFLPLIAISTNSFAEDSNYIQLGGFAPVNVEGSLQLRENGLGGSLDLDDALNLKSETQVFRLDGFYRFNPHHRIEYSYYSLKSKGTNEIDESANIGDDVVSAGAKVESKLNYEIFKVNYTYSFYRNDRVELGISAGIHATHFDTSLKAEGNVNGQPSQTTAASADLIAPLPVIGWRLHYDILQDLNLTFSYDLFALAYEDFKGSYEDSQLFVDYEVYKKFGVGAGINRTVYNISAEDGDTVAKLNRSMLGFMAFVSYRF